MKVTKNNETNFKPYKFTITVETEEEDQILNKILKLNITLPIFLEEYNMNRQSVRDIMDQIRNTII